MRTTFARAAAPSTRWLAAFILALAGRDAIAPLEAQQTPAKAPPGNEPLAKVLSTLRAGADSSALPPAEAFVAGDKTVAAGSTVKGPVAVSGGTLHVRGRIDGDAVTYRGDIIVHQGGEVSGNAIAILGKVTLDGGHVLAETRELGGDVAVSAAVDARQARSASTVVLDSFALAAGWLAVLAVVGIGVLMFASPNLDAVSDALARDFGRAFLAGLLGQLALLPALALLLVALALTVIGLLLIPFAIVAYVLAVIGLVTLGFLAVARVTGRTVIGSPVGDDRAQRVATLKALCVGLLILMVPWLFASALAWSSVALLVATTVSLAVTWVAATAGLGAALVSRGGVRRAMAPAAQQAMTTASWQTPTPVAGVAAARRPTPLATPVVK